MTDTPSPQSVVHDGPDTIWLEPSCCAGPSNGRTWCEDAAFPECEDGAKPTKYVRADLAAPAPSSMTGGEVERWIALRATPSRRGASKGNRP